MTATAESLLHQALKLSEQDRSELVDQLAGSIEPEADLSERLMDGALPPEDRKKIEYVRPCPSWAGWSG